MAERGGKIFRKRVVDIRNE